jgi:hypothetical protein
MSFINLGSTTCPNEQGRARKEYEIGGREREEGGRKGGEKG